MAETMVHPRRDYPSDPHLRDELAFQLRQGRREPRVRDAIRDLGKAMRSAESEQGRDRATAAVYDGPPGELVWIHGK